MIVRASRTLTLIVALAALAALGACTGQQAGEAVTVTLTEYEIDMPRSISAGPTTFQVTNEGSREHNFEIDGQGIEEEFESSLQPGDSQTLEVDLQPGTYQVYCPVQDHEQRGMSLTLHVTSGEPGAQQTAPEGTEGEQEYEEGQQQGQQPGSGR